MEQETNQPLTHDELVKLRKDNTEFMQEQIKHLKIHNEYAELKSSIATHILTEQMAKVKLAHLLSPPPAEKEPTPKTE